MADIENPETIDDYDVVVVGCGMAGICAGLSAQENDANTAILEKAPKEKRGGQTQFTEAIRVPSTTTDLSDYESASIVGPDDYSPSDFYQDIMDVTKGRADPELAQTLVTNAGETIEWLTSFGIEWTEETYYPDKADRAREAARVRHPGSEGARTLSILLDAADELGIDVYYDTVARKLHQAGDTSIDRLTAYQNNHIVQFGCDAVVIAAGAYEANAEKRTRYIGAGYEAMKVRGSRYVTGEAIDMAMDIGGKPVGQWDGAHMAVIDAAQPDFEGGLMRVDGYPYGVIVNHNGKRFVDEGADVQSKTYAAYGREVFEQPDNEAFVICDSTVADHVYSAGPTDAVTGNTIEELARRLGIGDVETTVETINEYNHACDPVDFDIRKLDGNSTTGISPPKSNWAIPIDSPPYYGYPATGGITFAFGGLKITTNAEVLDDRELPIPGLYAAGNSTGELFYYNYPGGTGQSNAAVFGKIAGEQAAKYVVGE